MVAHPNVLFQKMKFFINTKREKVERHLIGDHCMLTYALPIVLFIANIY